MDSNPSSRVFLRGLFPSEKQGGRQSFPHKLVLRLKRADAC